MKNQKGFKHWVIVILVSIMAVGLVGVAWYYEENKEEKIEIDAEQITENIYTDEYLGLSFKTPYFSFYTKSPSSEKERVILTGDNGKIYLKENNYSFDINNIISRNKDTLKNIEPIEVMIGNQIGYQFDNINTSPDLGKGCLGTSVFTSFKDNKTLMVLFNACVGDEPPLISSDKENIFKILSTFQFTN